MAKAEEWITEGAKEHLEAGEEVLVALVAQPRGHTQAVAGNLPLGDAKEARNVAAGEQAGFALESPMALALTPRRLIAFSISNPVGMGVGGKVKGVLTSAPIADVDAIEVKRLLMGARITLTVRGVEMKLEAGAGAKAKPLAEEFDRLKSS